MFTGLVEGLGRVTAIEAEVAGLRLTIAPPPSLLGSAFDDSSTSVADERDCCRLGDSVALNGCCLTVIDLDSDLWSFQAGTETLSKTNLGNLKVGDEVNLERSLPVHARLGGHFVQGHVDGVGTVAEIAHEGDWVTMQFEVPEELADLMVPKGSVAVDGVSLTLVEVTATRFSIALIPHTLEVTTLGRRRVGDRVNIETDILGKYVQKFLRKDRL